MAVISSEVVAYRDPADVTTLVKIDVDDNELIIPSECYGCEVLTEVSAAHAQGLVRQEGKVFYPDGKGKEAEVVTELVARADAAIDGTCKYVAHVLGCWRREI